MDKPQTLQELQQQSEEYFRKQFDPSSQYFHHGSPEPVPTGGNRVPDLMYSMYPEGYDPNKPAEEIDYGQEYRKIQEERNLYLLLKKSLAKIGPAVEAFLRHEQIFKEKGDPHNEHHLKIHEEQTKKEEENLKEIQKELEDYLPKLQALSPDAHVMGKQLMKILQESNKKYQTKEQLTDYNFKIKKLSTQIFSTANKCLQKLKDIKKEYQKKNKQEEEVSQKETIPEKEEKQQ